MAEDYGAWADEFAPVAVGDGRNRVAIAEFVRSLKALRPDAACAVARHVFMMDLRNRLDGFDIPTTIIQPSDDPAVPVEAGRYLIGRWPHAHLEIIDAVGHFPHLTEPRKVIEVLARVLAG